LSYVKNDIDRLRNYLLMEGGFDRVYVVMDEKATSQLLDIYMTDTFRNMLSPDDRLFFYFSGHGDDDGANNGYLLFSQAVPGQFGHDVLPVDRYRVWSARIKAKHVLFIFDSCAAGLGLVEKAAQSDREKIDAALMDTLTGSGSRQVITAGTAAEKAYGIRISNERGYSVFTDAFLRVLKAGLGEDPSQGFLTVEEVFAKASIDVGRFGVHPGYLKFDTQHRSGTFLFEKPLTPGATLSVRVSKALGLVQKRPDDARCRVHPVDGEEYCLIPKGTFEMGCADSTCTSAEAPHQAEAPNDFYIGRTEVTVRAYRQYIEHRRADTSAGMPPDPSHNRGWTKDSLPIVNITSDEAGGFCQSIGGRLPTELEWERAAKAGKSTRFPWSNQEDSGQANFKNSGVGGPTPAGTYPKNDFGLSDVAGNVAEWTSDTYSVDGTVKHAVKGGSYLTRPMSLGSRLLLDDERPHADVGFRCVVTVQHFESAVAGASPSN
jgi:formylglycine-generating enzyme required for sulfatase activity